MTEPRIIARTGDGDVVLSSDQPLDHLQLLAIGRALIALAQAMVHGTLVGPIIYNVEGYRSGDEDAERLHEEVK